MKLLKCSRLKRSSSVVKPGAFYAAVWDNPNGLSSAIFYPADGPLLALITEKAAVF